MSLIFYNILYYLKRKQKSFQQSLTTYTYVHPKYIEPLLSNLNQLSNKQNLRESFDLFKNNEVFVFGKIFGPIRFDYDYFNNYQFEKNVYKPAYFNKADIKVPYEIGRLQFLQKINLYFIQSKEVQKEIKSVSKIYCELLDQIKTSNANHVLWNSPMDVAIRMINLILDRNIKCVINENEDNKLLDELIIKHFEFIKINYENKGNVVGNHYFVELVATLFFLKNYSFKDVDLEIDKIIKEIESEINSQFNSDFTNFEGSTHYTALMIEALLLIYLSLENDESYKELTKKIKNIIIENKTFLKLLTIDNELSQIGDNDSGRLFYFLYDEKDPLNMIWLFDLIDLLIKNETKNSIHKYSVENSDSIEIESLLKVEHQTISIFQKEFDYYAYPDFGIYIWKNSTDYLSIRCGNLGQNGVGGHAHYDQLSIECYSNGKWFARDPGTGTYTDNIKVRNKYRSAESHWGPNLMFKNNQSFKECFELNNLEPGKVLIFSQNQFLGKAKFNDVTIYREIKIMDGQLNITDFSEDSSLNQYKSWSSREDGSKYSFSKGYKRFN